MRIALLSTRDIRGGAARAAWRLFAGLREAGHETTMVVARKASDDPAVHAPARVDLPEQKALECIQDFYIKANRTPRSDTYFSLGCPGQDVSAHPAVAGADIINLHWVAGFQSPVSMARLAALGKPLVWTLHDQRPFTGGCHYSAGCLEYERECAGCPQLQEDAAGLPRANLADQIALTQPGRITVVTPSRWLAACAGRSAMFRHSRIEVIPYSLETEVFRPRPKEQARARWNLSMDTTVFLFGADQVGERRKGFAILLQALERCLESPDFRERENAGRVSFLCFGDDGRQRPATKLPVRFLGRVDSDEEIAGLYSAADVFLLPSLEDNLPNTMIESMCCGTPVITSHAGGMPDVVTDGYNGLLTAPGEPAPLADAIRRLACAHEEREKMAENCRREMPARFALARQTQDYLRLFEELHAAPGVSPGLAPELPTERFTGFGPHFAAIFDPLLRQSKRKRRSSRWGGLARWLP